MSGSGDMHSNKLEALREKENAEKMIISKDYVSALDKLIRAQHLFPLDHIVSMLTVCEILSASSIQFPGYGVDYYWVLSLVPTSTIADVRHQYQKFVKLLQPVKNKFPGTKLALKLIEDAFSVLSDNDKRSAFDLHRNCTWRNYELPALEASSCSSGIVDHKVVNQDFYNFANDRKINNPGTGQIWAVQYHSNGLQNRRYAQIITNSISRIRVIWLKPVPVSNGERRWCEEGLPVACGSFCLDAESSEVVGSRMLFSYKCSWVPGLIEDQFDIYPMKGEVWALYEDWNLDEWSCNPDATKNCNFKLVEMLSDFCKYSGVNCARLLKVHGFRSVFKRQMQEGLPITLHISPGMLYILSHKVPAYRLSGGEANGVISGMLELDQLALPNNMIEKLDGQMMSNMETSGCASLTCPIENFSHITCPEEVFRSNQLLNAMTTGQIWAVYSGRELMPRQYVFIDNWISATQVSVTVLEPEPMTDLEMDWKKKNLPISCGLFRVGGTTLNLEVYQLSHWVKFEKTLSSYMIYPLKGQIWAMYREWNSKWHQSDCESCQYSVLEILCDFSEGEKIVVRRLVEVKGYSTFFHGLQLDGFEQSREIPRSEILSFSHEIPSYKVPGIGGHGIPEGSWHLEPNALPPTRKRTSRDHHLIYCQ